MQTREGRSALHARPPGHGLTRPGLTVDNGGPADLPGLRGAATRRNATRHPRTSSGTVVVDLGGVGAASNKYTDRSLAQGAGRGGAARRHAWVAISDAMRAAVAKLSGVGRRHARRQPRRPGGRRQQHSDSYYYVLALA